MSGNRNRRRNAIAVTLSATLHILLLSFVVNETVTPYALPALSQPPPELQIFPQEQIPPPPPPPVVIPPKIKQALEKQTPPPPPPLPPKPTPPKPEATPPTPVAPPKPQPPKPTPPKPAPPTPATPTPARPAPPKPNSLPAAPAPAKAPAPPTTTPSPSPGPKPAPSPAPVATVIAPSSVTARVTSPQIVLRPSRLNLHKTTHEVPANVPTLPMAAGGAPGGGGGGPQGGGAPGAPGGSRLSGLSPYPYGALPSGGPGLRGTLVGCANAQAVNLSSVERARCNARFGEEAGSAPVLDGIEPAKRARFDKTAGKQERDRAATMPVGTSAGAQGFGGLGGGPN